MLGTSLLALAACDTIIAVLLSGGRQIHFTGRGKSTKVGWLADVYGRNSFVKNPTEVLCIGFTLEPYRNVLGIAFYAGLPARYIRTDALKSRVTSRPTATISPGPERGIYELIKTAIII